MGALSRTKGRAAEQEIARILRDWLGQDVTRNWQEQAAHGGSDIAGIKGWAIEVKRAKEASMGPWWKQTCEQAEAAGDAPALCYRIDGQNRGVPPEEKWRVVVRLADIAHADVDRYHTAEISLAAWINILREAMRR